MLLVRKWPEVFLVVPTFYPDLKTPIRVALSVTGTLFRTPCHRGFGLLLLHVTHHALGIQLVPHFFFISMQTVSQLFCAPHLWSVNFDGAFLH